MIKRISFHWTLQLSLLNCNFCLGIFSQTFKIVLKLWACTVKCQCIALLAFQILCGSYASSDFYSNRFVFSNQNFLWINNLPNVMNYFLLGMKYIYFNLLEVIIFCAPNHKILLWTMSVKNYWMKFASWPYVLVVLFLYHCLSPESM